MRQKFNKYYLLIFTAILIGGCSTTSSQTYKSEGLLLSDHQMVRLTITEGTGSKMQGSLDLGKFRQGFTKKYNTFGARDHPVLIHTATQLTYRGPRTTCTLTIDRKIMCKDGGNGTWEYE